MLVTRYWLLVTRYWLLVAGYSLLATRYSLLVTGYSLSEPFSSLVEKVVHVACRQNFSENSSDEFYSNREIQNVQLQSSYREVDGKFLRFVEGYGSKTDFVTG